MGRKEVQVQLVPSWQRGNYLASMGSNEVADCVYMNSGSCRPLRRSCSDHTSPPRHRIADRHWTGVHNDAVAQAGLRLTSMTHMAAFSASTCKVPKVSGFTLSLCHFLFVQVKQRCLIQPPLCCDCW